MALTSDQIAELQGQMNNAEIVLLDKAEKIYKVTVPGAIREVNTVKASDEAEAKQKVMDSIAKRLDEFTEKMKKYPDGPTGHVEIEPGSVGGAN